MALRRHRPRDGARRVLDDSPGSDHRPAGGLGALLGRDRVARGRGVRSAVGGAGLSADPAPALPADRHPGAARLHRPRPESSPVDGGGGPARRVGAVADPAVQPVGCEVATLPLPDSAPAGPVRQPLAATRAPGCRAPSRYPGRPRRGAGGGRDVRRVAGGPHARPERAVQAARGADPGAGGDRGTAALPRPALLGACQPAAVLRGAQAGNPGAGCGRGGSGRAESSVAPAAVRPGSPRGSRRGRTIGSDRGRGRPLGTAGLLAPVGGAVHVTGVTATRARGKSAPERNRLRPEDRAVHDWYRFVLSFPSHLVRDYLDTFGVDSSQRVLDPFCGTGTTLVECKKLGIPSVGIERNPMAGFASRTKVDWSVDPEALLSHAGEVADRALTRLHEDGIDDLGVAPLFQTEGRRTAELRTLSPELLSLLLKNSISPLPLHKTLVLLDTLEQHRDEAVREHERLALATALVSGIGNLYFGPEVGVGKVREDAPVTGPWLERVRKMGDDLAALKARAGTEATVHLADSRAAEELLEPSSIDAVITSPPYPNEKDYTRTTRLESVLLGLVRSRQELRGLKQGLVRSNTRSVYKADTDDALVAEHEGIQRIARRIEERRVELGKTSGFERQYARVTKLYFGGMVRHLSGLRSRLRPGARLAYVVGDQASYLRVMIRTRRLHGELAQRLGYDM
ncbi:MAG: hypothetical protein F4Z60_06800, partial [Chloroflexi bacterium]|nr:hypothetical protein [Chloroflexota bacterium]